VARAEADEALPDAGPHSQASRSGSPSGSSSSTTWSARGSLTPSGAGRVRGRPGRGSPRWRSASWHGGRPGGDATRPSPKRHRLSPPCSRSVGFAAESSSDTNRRETGDTDDHQAEQSRHARPLDRLAALEARGPARARAPRVRHAAAGGLRAGQAPGHGLRDDHRSRHDRRGARARRPRRHLRLRGADRLVPGRAPRRSTSSATGSPPTTTAGSRATTPTSRRARSTSTTARSPAPWPTRSTRSRPR
jgi:hypothetical protein